MLYLRRNLRMFQFRYPLQHTNQCNHHNPTHSKRVRYCQREGVKNFAALCEQSSHKQKNERRQQAQYFRHFYNSRKNDHPDPDRIDQNQYPICKHGRNAACLTHNGINFLHHLQAATILHYLFINQRHEAGIQMKSHPPMAPMVKTI